MTEEKFYCIVCGKEITQEEYENFEDMCEECYLDAMTEEAGFF